MLKQGPLLHVLQYKIDILCIIKKAIKFQDIFMIAKALDFDLFNKLINHHVLFDILFG